MHLTMPEKTQNTSRRLAWFACAGALLAAAAVGGWYYYMSGRLLLDGVLQSNVNSLVAEYGGQVAEVAAVPGVRVRGGEVLIRFDETALRSTLMREEQELKTLTMLVPPHLLRVPGPDGGMESLTERLERQRLVEENAERRLQESTDREAQAAVLYSRASLLAAQGKLSRQELDGAEAHIAAARRAAQEARRSFETVSLERAGTGAEIQRMRAMQSAAGADRVPDEARLQSFEQKKARVAGVRAALAATLIAAPADGVVVDVAVRPGDRIAPMQPCLLFRPDAQPPQVRALVAGNEAGGIRAGQQCRVRFTGAEEAVFDGFVTALTQGLPSDAATAPGAGGSLSSVWVGFIPQEGNEARIAALEDGAAAEVTVLLRAPLMRPFPASEHALTPGAAAPSAPQPTFQGGPEPAAPAGAPLSVQTPYGEASVRGAPAPVVQQYVPPAPVVVRAGSPGALGRPPQADNNPGTAAVTPQGPPSLPPMRAPRQLTGSPQPDLGNNPSLAPSRMLDGEAHGKP